LFILLSIFEIESFNFGYRGQYDGKFTESPAEIPEVVLNSFDEDWGEVMKPAFDVIANATGLPYSESYVRDGTTGRWRRIGMQH
jgi:hypothetical protein